jgi:hypothetical protein
MRRRISSALGGSNSKEMIVSVTLGAYMAATCSASRSVASLMMAGDPFPEASLVMPIAFLRLACAVRPEFAPRGSPAHPPGGQNFGELHRPNFGEPLTREVRRIHLLVLGSISRWGGSKIGRTLLAPRIRACVARRGRGALSVNRRGRPDRAGEGARGRRSRRSRRSSRH